MAAEVMVLFGEKLVTCEGTLATHGGSPELLMKLGCASLEGFF